MIYRVERGLCLPGIGDRFPGDTVEMDPIAAAIFVGQGRLTPIPEPEELPRSVAGESAAGEGEGAGDGVEDAEGAGNGGDGAEGAGAKETGTPAAENAGQGPAPQGPARQPKNRDPKAPSTR